MRSIGVVAAALVVGTASTALACLNDSELPNHEREFRSQYLDHNLMTSRSPRGLDSGRGYHDGQGQVMSAAGIAMLAGAIGLTLVGRRPVTVDTGSDGIDR